MNLSKVQQKLNGRNIRLLEINQQPLSTQLRGILQCNICLNVWNTILHSVLYGKKNGCPQCAIQRRSDVQRLSDYEIDNRLQTKNIIRVDPYRGMLSKIKVKCVICSFEWKKCPSDIIHNNHGCPRCSKREKITNELIDKRIHEQQRTFCRIDESKGCMSKISWKCNICDGIWKARPNDIFSTHKSDCPYCKRKSFSKISLEWLKQIETELGYTLMRAQNGGEYRIPGTKWYADGYDPTTNTIYEFYGDRFHGNPLLFSENECCHPYDMSLTAGLLFSYTKTREEKIKQKGYTLIVMWENDWKNKQ